MFYFGNSSPLSILITLVIGTKMWKTEQNQVVFWHGHVFFACQRAHIRIDSNTILDCAGQLTARCQISSFRCAFVALYLIFGTLGKKKKEIFCCCCYLMEDIDNKIQKFFLFFFKFFRLTYKSVYNVKWTNIVLY